MKQKLFTWTIAAALLATPIISGCKKEEPPKVLYEVKTKKWDVRVEEKDGNKALEGNKDGYQIRIEEDDDSYNIKVKIPGE